MRALAVIAVMVYHGGVAHLLPGGFIGVDVFFVLSGFLITALLLAETDRSGGRVDMLAFYSRRALRLFPALGAVIVFVAILVLVDPRLQSYRHGTLSKIPFAILYVGNWAHVDSPGTDLLSHTLSLSVEEQFYLIWPLVFVLFASRARRRNYAAAIIASVALAVMVYRGVVLHLGWPIDRVYTGTDTHCDGLLLGCAVAFWLASGRTSAHQIRVLRASAPIAIVGLSLMSEILSRTGRLSMQVGLALAATGTAVILANLATAPFLLVQFVLSQGVVVWTGKRSYGLYLWHFPIYYLVSTMIPRHSSQGLEAWLIGFVTSFAVAAISYRYWERRWLLRKARFERSDLLDRRLRLELKDAPGDR
jgi:peptidoglycan/LPS O-acetylase OafA/YrhL